MSQEFSFTPSVSYPSVYCYPPLGYTHHWPLSARAHTFQSTLFLCPKTPNGEPQLLRLCQIPVYMLLDMCLQDLRGHTSKPSFRWQNSKRFFFVFVLFYFYLLICFIFFFYSYFYPIISYSRGWNPIVYRLKAKNIHFLPSSLLWASVCGNVPSRWGR